LNQAFLRGLREAKIIPPSLERITLLELLAPEQRAIKTANPRRERLLRSANRSWIAELTQKLDRLVFPETTQQHFKITEAHQIGRMLRSMEQRIDKSALARLRNKSLFGIKLRQKLEDAIWRFDGEFFLNLGHALNTPSSRRALLYQFLIRENERVSQCRRVADIFKLIPDNLRIDRSSFYTLCREIGLPIVVKG
jgi:hypothetical protein